MAHGVTHDADDVGKQQMLLATVSLKCPRDHGEQAMSSDSRCHNQDCSEGVGVTLLSYV